jgi:hypothetical protein
MHFAMGFINNYFLFSTLIYRNDRGLYVGQYPPTPRGVSANVIWEKNIKRGREKGGKCKRKRKKGERIREKGK